MLWNHATAFHNNLPVQNGSVYRHCHIFVVAGVIVVVLSKSCAISSQNSCTTASMTMMMMLEVLDTIISVLLLLCQVPIWKWWRIQMVIKSLVSQFFQYDHCRLTCKCCSIAAGQFLYMSTSVFPFQGFTYKYRQYTNLSSWAS
jgi:hypothetical protein